MKYIAWLPPEGTQILVVLFLSFLIGLEREERKAADDRVAFGGVRTFPLIGLIGYSMAVLSGGEILPQALGFAVVAAFLLMSYWHKLASSGFSGITSEMSGLATYLVGALVYRELFWVATTLTVASIVLLELKAGLEDLAKRIEPTDILTFAKFLLLSAVILPLVPNEQFGQFQINPFKTWLVVVAVSAVSYGSYVLQRLTKGQGGILLAALLGGAYSSTVTTVVLARRSMREQQAHLFAGGILIASGMMYLRLTVLLALFNRELMNRLALPFLVLAGVAIGVGWLWSRRGHAKAAKVVREYEPNESARIERSVSFCAAVSGHAGGDAPGDRVPGGDRRLHACRPDGRHRCGSFHHGPDPVDVHTGPVAGGVIGHSDRGGQQQCRQRHLCLRAVSASNRHAELDLPARPGCTGSDTPALVRAGTRRPARAALARRSRPACCLFFETRATSVICSAFLQD